MVIIYILDNLAAIAWVFLLVFAGAAVFDKRSRIWTRRDSLLAVALVGYSALRAGDVLGWWA